MSSDIEKAKGTRDLMPIDALAKERIIDAVRRQFKIYGFYPIENPIIERYETIAAKYAGGADILNEVFKLKDQGDRELALRFDLTVPLARYVASNPNVKLPFKRYMMGQVFRDGPVKTGRYREFTQADADIVGSKSIFADAECINLALDVFKDLGMKASIKINNRKLMDGILDKLDVRNKEEIILTIDKLDKIGVHEMKKELKMKGMNDDNVKKLLSILEASGNNKEKLAKAKKMIGDNQGINEIEELLKYVKDKRIDVVFSLARGLNYYTGNVYEAFSPEINASIAAGGRYDKMISGFTEGKLEMPAVGIAFGVDILLDIVNKKNAESETRLFIIPINAEKQAIEILKKIRKAGINADIDVMNRGISKNLDYASQLGIRHVMFIGKKELAKKKVKLRDMKTGKEKMITVKKAIDELA